MSNFRLYSHPGRRLFDHLKTVGNSCIEKMEIYRSFVSSDLLQNAAYIVGVTHDFAKATTFFQKMLEGGAKSKYSTHSGLSSIFTYFVCQKIFPDNERLCALSYLATKRHHGNLKNVWGEETDKDSFQVDVLRKQLADLESESQGWSPLYELHQIYGQLLPGLDIDTFMNIDLASMITSIIKSLKQVARQSDVDNYFTLLALYSALQESDKSDAANIQQPARNNEVDFNKISHYRSERFGADHSVISRTRNQAFNEIVANIRSLDLNERMLSITLPTGLGKTLAGFAASVQIRKRAQEELGYSPRIIYALPFLSIIDQNQHVLEEVLSQGDGSVPSNLLLVQHHLADMSYRLDTDEEETVDLKTSIFLTEGWHSEIILTTFVQLFHSIITNRKRMLRKFNNIAGSIIILDEVQAVPTKYWEVIESCMTHLCRRLGCWIILMSATRPNILSSCKELVSTEKYTEMERVRYTFRLSDQSLQKLVDTVLQLLHNKNKILCVLNTIGASKEVYQQLKSKLDDVFGSSVVRDGIRRYGDLHLIYLSSTVLPRKRHDRIQTIRCPGIKAIVVSTQVVEAGVDIDMDVVIRDFAPLDSIVQSAGRCNRNAASTRGDVIIFNLKDDATGKDYCKYVYDRIILDKTREITSKFENQVKEKALLAEIEKYFSKIHHSVVQEPIVNDIYELNFSEVGRFELIENYGSMQIFLETDPEAKAARETLESYGTGRRSKENGRLWNSELRKMLNSRIITVRKPSDIEVAQLLPCIDDTEIRYVPMEEIHSWYDDETGLDLHIDKATERRII